MCGQMYNLPDTFEVERPKQAWKVPEPVIENCEQKKTLFGIELAKHPPFKAATEVFQDDTNTAVYVSQHWINDPTVIAARDNYLKAADVSQTLLDKEQFARKLLSMAEEKNQSNTFYLLDGKDRLTALKLYAEVRGFTGNKPDLSINNNFVHNKMTIKLVSAEKEQKPKIIENEEPNINTNNSPLKLKLVG